MTAIVSLQQWRDVLAAGDDCPWPGPRPLTPEDDESLLCGRDRDLVAFRQAVGQNKLVILGGRTGIGKSSLLLRGLIPGLEDAGYLVLPCRDWSGAAGQADAAEFLSSRMRHLVVASGRWADAEDDVPHGAALFGFLNANHPKNTVLVLDQFEELIRDAPAFTTQLFAALAYLNHHTDMKVIISLRSEYDHELRPLEKSLRPLTHQTYVLDDVADGAADEIILAANKVAEGSVDPEFAAKLADAWRAARAQVGPAEVGLLHLQAMLFVLHASSDHKTVDRDVFDQFVLSHDPEVGAGGEQLRLGPHGAAWAFAAALCDAVDLKMDRCKDAAREIGLDSYLVEGTAQLAGRIVRHLSSAGYKLVREAFDLAELALGDDIEVLRRGVAAASQGKDGVPDGPTTTAQERALFQLLIACAGEGASLAGDAGAGVDLLDPRATLAAAADDLGPSDVVSWVDRLHLGADPRHVDPKGSTSGPMLGLAPAAALIEELRRFAFALEWMRSTQLVRLSTPRVGTVMVALVHDGFGAALTLWAESDALSPCGAIYGLTAPGAGEFVWKRAGGHHLPELDGSTAEGRKVRVLANLRWRGAFIRADFRSVVFTNCDFRGSQFSDCTFEGVTFVNCLLDGLMLSDCKVIGAADVDDDEQWLSQADVFEIHGVADVAAVLARYREEDFEPTVLLADKPQHPAVPAEEVLGRRQLTLHTKGLTIYGGRTSSLLIRRSAFDEGGCISLRETAGSGVDIVEHDQGGRYEMLGSRLRHVTFTSSPVRPGGGGDLSISIEKSLVYQLWLGSDLTGSLVAKDCLLLHCWNGSPSLRAVVVDSDDGMSSRYHGLVGFELEGDHQPLDPTGVVHAAADLDPDRDIRRRALGMDYRENAADAEQSDVLGRS